MKRELKIRPEEKIFLFIGLLNWRKGIDLLIQAAHLLRDKPLRFLIVGHGPQESIFKKEIQKLKLDDRVQFMGNTTKVGLFYSLSDVFILPSRGEGLPGVIMEAMAYGKPIIASNIPCIPELVTENYNGQLFQDGNVLDLVNKIEKAINEGDFSTREKGENSLKKIQEFDWEKVKNQYLSFYEEMISHACGK